MDRLRTKYEQWKLRRSPSSCGISKSQNQTSPSQCIAAPANIKPLQDQTAQAAEDPITPLEPPASGHSSRPDNDGTETASAELWGQALELVKKSQEWGEFSKVVSRQTGAQMDQIDGQGNPLHQLEHVRLQVKQLVETKAQATNKKFQTFLDGTMQTMQAIKDLGAGLTALNPYAAVGWGVVQFMITVAVADRAVRKEACESLHQVWDWTSRYQTFATIYTQTGTIRITKLQCNDTLLEVYTAILTYQINAVICLYSKMTRVKHSLAGQSSSRLRQALDDLSLKEQRWRSLEPAISREITDHHFKEIENSIEQLGKASTAILEEIRVISSNVESQRRDQVLEWISPLQNEDAHREPKRQPRPCTTDWLMKHEDYVCWNNDAANSCLWLRGKPGTGKSCLVHAVIDDQFARCSTDQEECQILFVYLDGSDKQRKDDMDHHEKILRSLVKQLAASSSKSPTAELFDIYEQQHRRGCLTESQCIDLLLSFSDASVALKIIVDGVSTPVVQRNLIRCLRSLILRRPEKMKLLVACRNTIALENLLQDLTPRTINIADHTGDAIRVMTESIVNESLQNLDLRFLYFIGTRELAPTIVEQVTQRARGMFRFAQIALDRLNRSRNAHLLEKRLEELNRLDELEALYDIEWDEAMKDQSAVEKELIITALNFLIHGFSYGIRENSMDRSPIRHNQHILEACTFLLKGKLDEAFSIQDLVAMCPSFMEISTRCRGDLQQASDSTLAICDFSINEYLVNRHAQFFGPAAANAAMAKLCMRIFVELDIETDFKRHPPEWLALYATLFWPEHARLAQTLPMENREEALMDPTLRAFLLDSACSKSFQRWTTLMKKVRENIVHARRGPFRTTGDEFVASISPILIYGFEGNLLVSVSLVTQPPSSLFARLYLGLESQGLEEEYCNLRATWEFGGTTVTPQTFAASMGLVSAISTLKMMGCSPNEMNDEGETSGHVLCTQGLVAKHRTEVSLATVLRALVHAGLRLDARNRHGNSCFFCLLKSNHFDLDIFKVFQEEGFDLHAPEPVSKRQLMVPQEFAVARLLGTTSEYRNSSLDVIVSYYNAQSTEAGYANKWLSLAVEYNDAFLVKLVITKYGADPTKFDEQGILPLQHALEKGVHGYFIDGSVIDILAPLTLKPGFMPRKRTGFNMAVAQAMLLVCAAQTIKLFVEYVFPIVPEHCAWTKRPITTALLNNSQHGKEIAEYLESVNCPNVDNSRIYRKWQRGELPDHEIGMNGKRIWQALAEDVIGEEEDADDQFWDAQQELELTS